MILLKNILNQLGEKSSLIEVDFNGNTRLIQQSEIRLFLNENTGILTVVIEQETSANATLDEIQINGNTPLNITDLKQMLGTVFFKAASTGGGSGGGGIQQDLQQVLNVGNTANSEIFTTQLIQANELEAYDLQTGLRLKTNYIYIGGRGGRRKNNISLQFKRNFDTINLIPAFNNAGDIVNFVLPNKPGGDYTLATLDDISQSTYVPNLFFNTTNFTNYKYGGNPSRTVVQAFIDLPNMQAGQPTPVFSNYDLQILATNDFGELIRMHFIIKDTTGSILDNNAMIYYINENKQLRYRINEDYFNLMENHLTNGILNVKLIMYFTLSSQ